jgi:hypothetical protein
MKNDGRYLAEIARQALLCLIPATTLVATGNAGAATGTASMVEVRSIGATFRQLDISPTFNYELACRSPSMAYLLSPDPLSSSFFATMMTSGCIAIPGSQQTRVADIQLGTRLQGT